jgi:hypothetical protein
MLMPMLPVVLAAALSPQIEGARLHPDEACYAIYAPKSGVETVIGATRQTLRRETLDGRPVWRVIVHQHLNDGHFDLRDELILDGATLRPIRLETTANGRPHAHLDYSPSKVTGFRMKEGKALPIDQPLHAPVWDGDLYGPTFAALPLLRVPSSRCRFTSMIEGAASLASPSRAPDVFKRPWVRKTPGCSMLGLVPPSG